MKSYCTPILLVDDSELSRVLLARNFERSGFEVLQCSSGPEALAIIETGRPMLVVLDYDMPDMNGAQVCVWVRRHTNPVIASLPIIMLTGHAGQDNEIECLQAGADDFVTKPVNIPILYARIETQLRLHSLRAQLSDQNAELERWRQRHELDLDAAQLTQRAILPLRPPLIDGWQIAALYEPLIQVGGDIYDWLRMPNGAWLFWIADATGHGAAAALLTTLTKLVFLHAATRAELSAEGILEAVNADVYAVFKGRSYLTAACLVIEPGQARLDFAGAGHPPLLIVRNDGRIEQLNSQAPPLGVRCPLGASHSSTEIAPGETVLLYTDGLYSMKDDFGRQLTSSDALSFLPPLPLPAAEFLDRLHQRALETANGQPFFDDLAAVALHRPAAN